jgi:hypothetical protein
MTIKEIIKIMGTFLGRDDVTDYLSGKTDTIDTLTLHAVEVMGKCVNLVISELSRTYLPMTTSQTFTGTEIQFSLFNERVTKIIGVYSKSGKQKPYDFYPDKIILKGGETLIEYEYIPKNYEIDEEIGYNESEISKSVIAFGAISELCLIERSFDESLVWRNRYMENLKKILLPKNKKIKERSWL